jgi:uncharacterized protein YbaP (TraB family)
MATRSKWAQISIVSCAFAVLATPAARAACNGIDAIALLRITDADFVRAIDEESARLPFGRGKLFKLTRQGRPPSWVYGTIHSGDLRVTRLSNATLDAMRAATKVGLELDTPSTPLEQLDNAAVAGLILNGRDESLDKILSPAEQARLFTALKAHGISVEAAKKLRASILAILIATPACASQSSKDGNGLDAIIERMAKQQGKTVVGLETTIEQLETFTQFSAPVQGAFLKAMVGLVEQSENLLEGLAKLYLNGQSAFALTWARRPSPHPRIGVQIPPEIYEAIVDKRNARLFARALPLADSGGAFVAVGLLHLPGESGLLRLFEKAGYKVEMIE